MMFRYFPDKTTACAATVIWLLALGVAPAAPQPKKGKPPATRSQSAKEMYALALMHLNGTMVQKDEARAAKLMQQAADRGYVPAMYYLGVFYHGGIGVHRDRNKAGTWLHRAAELGNSDAEYAYGLMLLGGDGVAANREEGLEWIGRAARQGDQHAADFLRRLVSYRGSLSEDSLLTLPRKPAADDESDAPPPFEGKGLVLDRKAFSLRFSLPDLGASPYPRIEGEEGLMDRLQGGNVEIIVPLGK